MEKNGTKPQIPQPAFRLKNAFKVDFLKRPPENKKPYASIYCLAQIKYHIPRKVSSLIFILPWLLWNKFNIQHTKGRKNKLQYLCLKIAPNCAIRLLPRDLPFPRAFYSNKSLQLDTAADQDSFPQINRLSLCQSPVSRSSALQFVKRHMAMWSTHGVGKRLPGKKSMCHKHKHARALGKISLPINILILSTYKKNCKAIGVVIAIKYYSNLY